MSTGAMGMSAKVMLGLIVVIAMGSSQSFAAPQQSNSESSSHSKIQFTRCDNSTEPLGKIEISACKDQEEFCIFKYGIKIAAEIEFTPEKTHTHADIGFVFGAASVSVNACNAEGAKCPFEAGAEQHIKAEIVIVLVEQKGNKARLFVTDDSFSTDPYWYCVEMPAKLID